jgi:hypothetical protein
MTMQWPSERKAANQPSFANDAFRTEADFQLLLGVFPEGLPQAFWDAVDWVVQDNGDTAALEQRMGGGFIQVDSQDCPDRTNLLMALVCAAALSQAPSLETWKKVRSLKSNSWQLEHWLANAMEAYVTKNTDTRKAYIALATVVLKALDSGTLVSQSDRTNQERIQAWDSWKECQNKLDEIWWGLRWWNEMNYEEEFPLFHLLSELDTVEFIKTISESGNPYLVHSVLIAAGVSGFCPRFSKWEKLAIAAPLAFEQDGTWNGSVLTPLLLVEARTQLLQAGRDIPAFDASSEDVSKVKQEIARTIESVVSTLATRQDALPLFARWTTWLMRQLLSYSEKNISDVRSAAFIDDALIESIGRWLKGRSVILSSPSNAPAWEAWCYRCVLASHAHSGFISPQGSTEFLSEWAISPDEWARKKGQGLRQRASLIVTMSKETPGVAANSLAYPIVQSESPTEAWIELWNTTQTLREIVEFGDADASDHEYQTRAEAGKLILLVFRIGLAIFDQRASQCENSELPQARSQAKLHEALAAATNEMREIDDTLNRDEWIAMVRHLVIRRFLWEEQTAENNKLNRIAIFRPSDAPTFSNYLKAANSDAVELVALIQSLLLNDCDISRIDVGLRSALIDVSAIVDMVERLNCYSSRRYPMDKTQMQGIRNAFQSIVST